MPINAGISFCFLRNLVFKEVIKNETAQGVHKKRPKIKPEIISKGVEHKLQNKPECVKIKI